MPLDLLHTRSTLPRLAPVMVPTICPPELIPTMLLIAHHSKQEKLQGKTVELSSVCFFNSGKIQLIDARSIAKLRAVGIQATMFICGGNSGIEADISVRDFTELKIMSR